MNRLFFTITAIVSVMAPASTAFSMTCSPAARFHLERLKANKSVEVKVLSGKYINNVQRYINMTEGTPINISDYPRAKVYLAWQPHVVYAEGFAPPQGVIDVVEDKCVIYRLSGDATRVVNVALGHWSLAR